MDSQTYQEIERQVLEMVGFCNECHHPCHCSEEKELHADEYGVCTCENCKCKDSKIDEAKEDEV